MSALRILSLDTADTFCTLVLSENGEMRAAKAVEAGREQAKILALLTEEFLNQHHLKIVDLDRLAICTGPGSFTGLRVGLAFARGLAMAARKPLLGFDHFICTQHALSRSRVPLPPGGARGGNPENTSNDIAQGKTAPPPTPPGGRGVLIIRDSGREELFAHLDQPFLATANQLADLLHRTPDLLFTGNGAPLLLSIAPQLVARHTLIAREDIVFSAAQLAEHATAPGTPPEPFYLREADVTFPNTR